MRKACLAYVEGVVGRKEGNKCLDDRPKWIDDKGINKDRRYVCGAKKLVNGKTNSKADHYKSGSCSAPGGGDELTDIAAKVQVFLFAATLPKRPNGEEPNQVRTPEDRFDRQRSKSRSRGMPQPSKEDDGIQDKWGYGEELEKKRQKVKKLMRTAQKELNDKGTVTDELHAKLLSSLGAEGLEAEEEESKRILESIPIVERMTKIRNEIKQRQEQQIEERFQKGEIFKMFETEVQGEDYQRGDQPGSSSQDIPRIRVIRVSKVEFQDDTEEDKHQRFIMTLVV